MDNDIIIFVDDDPYCHELFSLFVSKKLPFRIEKAYSSMEAIAIAKKNNRNTKLIVSDILLPDINGYDLYKVIRSEEKLSHIPFIFQSGLTDADIHLEKHIDAKTKIVYKPYAQDDLLKAIIDAIEPI